MWLGAGHSCRDAGGSSGRGRPATALASIDGGEAYWHARDDGDVHDDPAAMVVDEFLPLLQAEGVTTDRIGLMGWSKGGHGALHIAGLLGAERVGAVAALSPSQAANSPLYAYSYERLCHSSVPDQCAPRPCDAAGVPKPSYLFAVIQTSLSTGVPIQLGGGCYTVKDSPPVVTPADVLKKVKEIEIPRAAIAVQPPGGKTLVNLKTIVSSDAKAYERDVSIFGQTVHLWLRPAVWTWSFGDGSSPLVRRDAGVAWTQGVEVPEITAETYTFHEYAVADTVEIVLTVTWSADFSVDGGPVRAVPGDVDISSPGVPVSVLEAKPQLVVR